MVLKLTYLGFMVNIFTLWKLLIIVIILELILSIITNPIILKVRVEDYTILYLDVNFQ